MTGKKGENGEEKKQKGGLGKRAKDRYVGRRAEYPDEQEIRLGWKGRLEGR